LTVGVLNNQFEFFFHFFGFGRIFEVILQVEVANHLDGKVIYFGYD